ncbi:DNA-binding protein [Brevibacillus invocatus]|uniref:DNA-binding protein n=2 Tax=Brevibacillus invocatus TaxID=173959 RepID=A0A3M8C4Z6_9BACL|nr:DNA-binding protein [Brevibacillus invocatus]
MDVDVLIKEVHAYRELLQNIEKEKPKVSEIGSIEDDLLADYHHVLTPKDIQNILGIGRRQTYELMNSGELPVVRVGRLMRISKSTFIHWLKGQK